MNILRGKNNFEKAYQHSSQDSEGSDESFENVGKTFNMNVNPENAADNIRMKKKQFQSLCNSFVNNLKEGNRPKDEFNLSKDLENIVNQSSTSDK